MRGQAGFSVLEMVMATAMLAFVVFASFMGVSTLQASSSQESGRLDSRGDAYQFLEHFRASFMTAGGGWHKRTVGTTFIQLTQQRATGAGTFRSGDTVRFETSCQPTSAAGYPSALKGVTLPALPSLCEGFSCGGRGRPVIVETRRGATNKTKSYPLRGGSVQKPTVAQALCLAQRIGHIELEVWSARVNADKSPVWERQAMVLPLNFSVSGYVNYIPLKD